MRKNIILILTAALSLLFVSCNKEVDPNGNTEDCGIKYSFSANVGDPETKVTYHDNIGAKDNPYNPNSDGSNKITMSWRHGDELVAIRWKEPYDEYVVLQANIAEGDEDHSITFDTETATQHFKTQIEDGEKFVLVHGDFVLDPDPGDHGLSFEGVLPKINFPTSEISKADFASKIHHGGIVDGTTLTFRNQDGTLENLRKHEYMVADAYVHFEQQQDEEGVIKVRLTDAEGESVSMHIAHTLLRLTMFLPDEDFDNGYDDDLIAVSIKDINLHNIFHRYFRMHPNATDKAGDPNYYRTSYNPNSDKEENPYIRINLVDEETGKYGVSHRINNTFGANDFNPKKPVCVPATLSGKQGHYVTLYFSLPSRHMGVDGQGPCELAITAFTRTHAYRTKKSYRLPDAAMKPGQVVPLNVNFVGNSVKFKAITDPELGITFSPGLVYATKANTTEANWTYGIYQNQGEYAGLNQQTDVMGDYFIFGSVDPTEVYHQQHNGQAWENHGYGKNSSWRINSSLTSDNDVAAKVEIDGVSNIFSTMTKAEAERVWKRIQDEAINGVNKGFYYYDAKDHDTDALHHTAHQAVGAHRNLPVDDVRRSMSSTMGIWIGIDRQPNLDEQDLYVFLPSSHQLNNSISNMQWYDSELHEWFDNEDETSEEAGYENVENYRYAASADYGKQHVYCIGEEEYNKLSSEEQAKFRNIPTTLSGGVVLNHYYLIQTRTVGKAKEYGLEGADYTSMTMKFSTNTRDVGTTSSTCQRFQVWYASGTSFSNSGIAPMDQTFGRVVRPVIY